MKIEFTKYQEEQLRALKGYASYDSMKDKFYKENVAEKASSLKFNEARFTNVMLAKLICFFLFKLYKQMGGKDTFDEVYNEALVETN